MPYFDTSSINISASGVLREQRQIYNGLDCMLTLEIFEEITRGTNRDLTSYNFSRALQGPILEIMLRGFRVDKSSRHNAVARLREREARLRHQLNAFAYAVWEKPLNPRSPQQLQQFFYTTMNLPEIWISQKGERKLSMNREALEKLDLYFYARPIVSTILAIRACAKQIEVLETEISPDGRMRTSYNIGGTETGRLSSSASADGTGSNLQNIEAGLRHIFIADEGMELCVIDLEQAESREVGLKVGVLFNDWSYLDACEGGDLHTTTCKLIWPHRPWSGNPKGDKAMAEENFYRHYSYRDMSKRGGHGCLTEDHEVLTRDGWTPIANKPQEILTWSPSKSEFAEVSNWTDFPYTGQLYHWEGNSISLAMTAEHRMPYRKDVRSPWYDTTAEKGPGKYMPLGNYYTGGSEVVPARLIAAFMADGHQKSTNRMEFHLKKERKRSRLQDLCKQYDYRYIDTGKKIYVIGCLPKYPGAFQLNWTADCLRDFVDELKHWDGHISATAVSIASARKEDLEWYQTFGRILGIGGNIQKPQKNGFGFTTYTLQQNNRQYANGPAIQTANEHVTNCRVFCPTVPSSYFYVRRNGKIFVTGNSNYYGTPFTMARHLKVPAQLMVDFQERYFEAFPGIRKWHQWVAQQLQTTQTLTTFWGRERQFFGRPNDDTTLREAIAFEPQSCTADRTNFGLYRIWKEFGPKVQLLAQTHDSVSFQYPRALRDEVVPRAVALMEIPITVAGRTMVVPGEAKVGYNWGYQRFDKASGKTLNPNGLRKYSPGMKMERVSLLDLPIE